MEKEQEKIEEKEVKKKPKKLYIALSILFMLLSIFLLIIGQMGAALGPFFLAVLLILYVKKPDENS